MPRGRQRPCPEHGAPGILSAPSRPCRGIASLLTAPCTHRHYRSSFLKDRHQRQRDHSPAPKRSFVTVGSWPHPGTRRSRLRTDRFRGTRSFALHATSPPIARRGSVETRSRCLPAAHTCDGMGRGQV